ncbi:hypothetical protein ACK2LA_006363 [Pseudomonas aeruginosa]
MKTSYAVMTVVAATAMLIMTGCATSGQSERLVENKKKMVEQMIAKLPPRTEWSAAQSILIDGFGLISYKDVRAESVKSAQRTSDNGIYGLEDIGLGLAGASAPAGTSGATAFAMGAGLFLLGGGSDPTSYTQIAAWVPSNVASSATEATQITLAAMDEARRKTYPGELSKLEIKSGKFLNGTTSSYSSLGDSLADRPIPFAEAAKQNPSFIGEGHSYGPIYIRNDQMVLDAHKSNLDLWGSMITLSKNLPDWIYIYYPGQKLSNGDVPPAIFNKGKPLLFIK